MTGSEAVRRCEPVLEAARPCVCVRGRTLLSDCVRGQMRLGGRADFAVACVVKQRVRAALSERADSVMVCDTAGRRPDVVALNESMM